MSKYTVYLRNNETGEERGVENDGPWNKTTEYLWTDGNFGCDCNRALLFASAKAEKNPQRACGDGGFLIVKVVLDDGTELRDYE